VGIKSRVCSVGRKRRRILGSGNRERVLRAEHRESLGIYFKLKVYEIDGGFQVSILGRSIDIMQCYCIQCKGKEYGVVTNYA
jgi:hypothetical protein